MDKPQSDHTLFFPSAENKVISDLKYHSRPVLCLLADEKFVITGSEDQSICVFDRRAGQLFKTIKVQIGEYNAQGIVQICSSYVGSKNLLKTTLKICIHKILLSRKQYTCVTITVGYATRSDMHDLNADFFLNKKSNAQRVIAMSVNNRHTD